MNEPLRIVIKGQVMGGKNHINITRTGHRYPNKSWAVWRDKIVREVRDQLPEGFKPFNEPVSVSLDYTTGDKRRRDMPAIIDAIWHALEKAGVVEDDTLLWVEQSSRIYRKGDAGVHMILLTELEFKLRLKSAREAIF